MLSLILYSEIYVYIYNTSEMQDTDLCPDYVWRLPNHRSKSCTVKEEVYCIPANAYSAYLGELALYAIISQVINTHYNCLVENPSE